MTPEQKQTKIDKAVKAILDVLDFQNVDLNNDVMYVINQQKMGKTPAIEILAGIHLRAEEAVTEYITSVINPPKKQQPKSRAERFEDAKSLVSDGKAQMEELRDELQSWRDNLPENLQDGQKANELDDAIGNLESAISQADEIEGSDVEFPRMF